MNKKPNSQKKPDIDTQAAVEALEYLFAAGYVSRRRLYFANFMRGVFFSVGSILGATVVIAFLLWFLSLFGNVPLVGDFVRNLQETINTK